MDKINNYSLSTLYNIILNKNNENLDDIKKKNLSVFEKENIINEIFKKSFEKEFGSDFSNHKCGILTENTCTDLEFFKNYGDNNNECLFDKLNKTNTTMGKLYLKNLLKNPVTDIDKLLKRQNIIKYFVNNKDIYNKLQNLFNSLNETESNILWFWKKIDEEESQFYDIVYFKNSILKFFNNSELCLRLYNYYQLIICPTLGVIGPILFMIIPFLILKLFYKVKIKFEFYFQMLKMSFWGMNDMVSMLGGTKPGEKGFGNIIKYISTFFYIIFYLHGTLNSIELAKTTNKITNIIHEKLINLSKFIKKAYDIHNYVSEIVLDKKPFEKNNLIIELWDDIFEQTPNIFSNKGKILVTFKKIKEHKNIFLDILFDIGKIDSYLSITKLYLNNIDKKGIYSFCNYVKSNNNNGLIEMDDVWHPYLNPDNVTTNNLRIGKGNNSNKYNNIILTGANASGKSTFIKSITLSLILSQTLGITCCRKSNLTPFSLINTYLNIPDCKGKESLFEAEMHRSKQYIDLIKKLKKNEYSFIIMDEIFSSTNPEEGISGAFSIADFIGSFNNNISIITSHYQYLTKLEKMTNNFVNYQMPVIIKTDKNIVYPYKFQKGISKQYIALDLLKLKGFDENIVIKAKKICKKITKKKSEKIIEKNEVSLNL